MQAAEIEPEKKIAQAGPTAQNERIVIVDILRGFALFGVLQGNFSALVNNNVPDPIITSISTSFDFTLDRLHDIFIQNKFMTLFSILFGYGFGVIMERVKKKNLNTTHFFLRRMFWLFLFGCVQLAFWDGDILHVYAAVGIFLLLFQKSGNRAVLLWSLLFMFVFPFLVRLCQEFIIPPFDYSEGQKTFYNTIKYGTLKEVAILNYSTYPQLYVYNLNELRDGIETLGRFLFGYYILRRQILLRLDDYSLLIRKTWKASFLIMAIYIVLWLLANYQFFTSKLWIFPFLRLGAFATTLFYATSLILLFQKGVAGKLMEGFHYLGRMTLTNYLMHTVVYILIFYNVGFGLLGVWSFTEILIASLLLYLLQIIFSRWWLSKFLYGPMEWIWRQLTYQKRFPLLKNNSASG